MNRRTRADRLEQRPAPPIVNQVLASPGQPLDATTARRMSGVSVSARARPASSGQGLQIAGADTPAEREAHRLSAAAGPNSSAPELDFSRVRIHSGPQAAASARAIHARAYAAGNHIVFGDGQFDPHSARGSRLLAHELAHVAQQAGGPPVVQRSVTFDECSSDQEEVVQSAHDRAMEMVQNAIDKLDAYDGTDPAEVKTAMNRHFHGTSTTLAWWLRQNLIDLKSNSDSPQYECESEPNGSAYAQSLWCLPFTDIELYPSWFALPHTSRRARTLIHEWVHRYGCNFDLGYEHSDDYPNHSTVRALLNADSWAHFVYDIR